MLTSKLHAVVEITEADDLLFACLGVPVVQCFVRYHVPASQPTGGEKVLMHHTHRTQSAVLASLHSCNAIATQLHMKKLFYSWLDC